jgi:hypothetical protein
MVNIRIPGQKDFRCQAGQRAEDVVNTIRASRLFAGGEIERNEFAMLSNDLITEDGDYAFVNPVQAPSQAGYSSLYHYSYPLQLFFFYFV